MARRPSRLFVQYCIGWIFIRITTLAWTQRFIILPMYEWVLNLTICVILVLNNGIVVYLSVFMLWCLVNTFDVAYPVILGKNKVKAIAIHTSKLVQRLVRYGRLYKIGYVLTWSLKTLSFYFNISDGKMFYDIYTTMGN